jgi:antitoxin component YwqK of YwqJK toxin-antitoxin module
MKNIFQLVMLFFCLTAFSQEQKVDYKKLNDNSVHVTYYFANNSSIIQREGFFNKKGKLQGTWIDYDIEGNKTIIANYENGIKNGIWTYIKKDKISIVTYTNNKITNVETKELIVH